MTHNKAYQIVSVLVKTIDSAELNHIYKILSNEILSSDVIKVDLQKTRCNIIARNNYVVYCVRYSSLGGLFKKGTRHRATTIFGRIICDIVKKERNNYGFFTTDELPAYGISRKEKIKLNDSVEAKEEDLVVCLLYDFEEATKTKQFLDNILKLVRNEMQHIIDK